MIALVIDIRQRSHRRLGEFGFRCFRRNDSRTTNDYHNTMSNNNNTSMDPDSTGKSKQRSCLPSGLLLRQTRMLGTKPYHYLRGCRRGKDSFSDGSNCLNFRNAETVTVFWFCHVNRSHFDAFGQAELNDQVALPVDQ
jgi:hypothetical protein